MTDIDHAYGMTQAGDEQAFAAWVRLVEMPLRASLRRFAPVVDVEEIVQEGLVRMWRLAPGLGLSGANASLHYVRRLARNLAISEARRLGTVGRVDLDRLETEPEGSIQPVPMPDARLGLAIRACMEQLPARPREALTARIHQGGVQPDRDLARGLNMQLNTFLQNIVRARRLVALCLERAGRPLTELLS
jgi:DNA-directed RNA polymerase specialized sigma24 family protein